VCTILLAWRCLPGVPVVLAANRDEFRGRASAAPGVLVDPPRIAGGRDLVAGGTWMAVAADGRVGAVTNRHAEMRDPRRRSRGELPLAVLRAGRDAAARDLLEGLDAAAYNPFNVLAVSRGQALVGHGTGRMEVVELAPGPHVLTVVDVDQEGDPKVEHLRAGLDAAVGRASGGEDLLLAMEELLRDPEWACLRGDIYGTVSSSSVLIPETGEVVYRHAAGPPCETAHEDLSGLLRGEQPAGAPAAGQSGGR
jgi:uncharacterized protein with NRDE domain